MEETNDEEVVTLQEQVVKHRKKMQSIKEIQGNGKDNYKVQKN